MTTLSSGQEHRIDQYMFEQYRALTYRLILMRVLGRLVFTALCTVVALMAARVPASSVAISVVGMLVGAAWYLDQAASAAQLRAMEEPAARRSGSEWEDVYIRSRFLDVSFRRHARLLRLEPLIWLVVFLMLVGTTHVLTNSVPR